MPPLLLNTSTFSILDLIKVTLTPESLGLIRSKQVSFEYNKIKLHPREE